MSKHRLLISLVVAVIGISAIVIWIATAMPTAAERDAAQKDSDISEFMTGIKKIQYFSMGDKTILNRPTREDIAALNSALRNAKWNYDQWPKGSLPDIIDDEKYLELIYEEGESRRFVIVLNEYWTILYWNQERDIEIKGESLKEFLSTLRSRYKPERND